MNDEIAMDFPVCSGKEVGTPRGSYTVLEKQVQYTSNLYSVSMPCFMRLTYDGIDMHVGYVGRSPSPTAASPSKTTSPPEPPVHVR